MSFILTALLLVIFIGVVASIYTDGLWGNAIAMINVVTSALVATSFFESVANLMEGWGGMKSYTYLLDFISLWLLFGVTAGVLRGITDVVCKVKVRFMNIADQVGGIIFACLVAWVMVCFTTFTLHTAPLGKNFLFGGFQSDAPMLLGFSPDKAWLNFTRKVSKGAFCRSDGRIFDPYGQLRAKYERRRIEIEKHVTDKGSITQ